MSEETTRRTSHRGTLPRFRDLMQGCRERTAKSFAALFKQMLDDVDEILIKFADRSDSDAARNQTFEVIQEIQLRRLTIEQDFFREVAEGFIKFDQGKIEPNKPAQNNKKLDKLSLVDKDDFEITVIVTNISTNGLDRFSEELYALNQRLAVINGGTKLGEHSAALPTGPKHLCDAFLTAMRSIEMNVETMVCLLNSFNKYVIQNAGGPYNEFNASLIRSGVLANLSLGAAQGYSNPQTARTPPGVDQNAASPEPVPQGHADQMTDPQYEADLTGYSTQSTINHEEEELKQALFQGISEILSRRRHGQPVQGGQVRPGAIGVQSNPSTTTTNLTDLVLELNRLQQTSVPYVVQAPIDQSISSIKDVFSEQIGKLSEIMGRQQVESADADIIDLVGMIFEVILDDEHLPDAVKALLSHLHTPFLKIAVLDKKFFVRNQHPARRLLNALSRAGSLCDSGDGASLGIIAKMREIVNKILEEFDDNTEIFTELLEEFTAFMTSFNRRTMMTEKRSVQAAKGREKLQTARRTVSHEVVNRMVDHGIPKVVESLLMGPWANYLVITLLRSGANSPEWISSLETTDDLIWSVERKKTEDDRQLLRLKLPKIVDAVRAGLDLAGDPDLKENIILKELEACHKAALAEPKAAAPSVSAQPETEPDPLAAVETVESVEKRLGKLKEIVPEEWRETLADEEREIEAASNASPERQSLLDSLRKLEFGTWFEFIDQEKDISQRGKLAWVNTTTSNYMFVNEGGRQIGVKSLYNLADELESGQAKIIDEEKTPFVDRALKSIHGLLNKESA